MTETISYIPSRIKNAAVGGHVAGAEDIYDDEQNKTQAAINAELIGAIGGGGGGGGGGSVVQKVKINNEEKTPINGVVDLGTVITSHQDISGKVDKEEGKSLIDAEYATSKSTIENPEYLEVTTDSEDKVLEGIKADGTKVIGGDINVGGSATIEGDVIVKGSVTIDGNSYKVIENPEFVWAVLDNEDKVLCGISTEGKFVADFDGIDEKMQQVINEVQTMMNVLTASVDEKIAALEEKLNFISWEENPEYISVETDSADKIVEATRNDGTKVLPAGIETPKIDLDGTTIKTVDNPEFIGVWLDATDHILMAIKANGDIMFGVGVPSQIKAYIDEKIAEFSPESVQDIIDFIGEYLESTTLEELLSKKVDGEYVENPYFINVNTDSEGRIIEAIRENGIKYYGVGIEIQDVSEEKGLLSKEFIRLIIDDSRHPLFWINRSDGSVDWQVGVPKPIKKELDNIKDESDNTKKSILEYIPDYYFADSYLDDKVDTINAELESCIDNGDAFFFITDTHWEFNEKHSPALVKYIKDHTNIDTILHGGDLYQKKLHNDLDFNKMFLRALGNGRLFYANGNHEYIDYTSYTYAYAKTGVQNHYAKYGDDSKLFYYVDVPQRKMRYISLSSFGERSRTTGHYAYLLNPTESGGEVIDNGSIANKQYIWFRDIALNVDAGWTIVVFTHAIYTAAPEPAGLDFRLAMGAKYVELMDSYMSDNAKNGEIACVLLGHSHCDRIHYSEAGIPYIITTTDAGGNFYYDEGWRDVDRTVGTVHEQAFDVVVINRNITTEHPNKTVKLIRIGALATNGIDLQQGVEVEERVVTYPSR